MTKKFKIILATYTIAALVALGGYSFAANRMLAGYELAARYSSARAFEETVLSVDKMKTALEKCQYATDNTMLSKLCSEAYASALAAETAMSTLPFSNYRLEQTAALLNFAGDYAYTLGRQGLEKPDEKQLEELKEISKRSGEFSQKLRELQSSVNSGELIMDNVQSVMGNISQAETGLVSEAMLEYEAGMNGYELPEYDGKYNVKAVKANGELSQDEMKALAATYAGVEVQQLKEEYAYAGEDGRKCYSVGGTYICVSPAGVESLGQTRLVSEVKLSDSQAEKAAEDYLEANGYKNLSLSEKTTQGAVSVMKFAATEDGVLWPDNYIKVAIAMDDGSVYSFDSRNYSEAESGVAWTVDKQKAIEAMPESLTLDKIEKVIINSNGGKAMACYKLLCTSENGTKLELIVNANSGKQQEISFVVEK